MILRKFAVGEMVDHRAQLSLTENVTDVTFVWGFSPPPVCQNSHHSLRNFPRTLGCIGSRGVQSFW